MAGEMTQDDLEVGGEFYESRVLLEDFVKKVGSGYKCIIKPFDKYQGPFAQIFKGDVELGSLWIGTDPQQFFYEFDSKEERIEINSEDDLFYLLISIYETFHLEIAVLKVKSFKTTLKVDLMIDGEKFYNVGLGTLPNRNDARLSTINNEDHLKYIEISSSYLKKKRIINF